jgi:hypothetical protein
VAVYDVDDNGEQENLAGKVEVKDRERELKGLLMARFQR